MPPATGGHGNGQPIECVLCIAVCQTCDVFRGGDDGDEEQREEMRATPVDLFVRRGLQ